MSDRLREAIWWFDSSTPDASGLLGNHHPHLETLAAAARRWLALTETGPDYEAAARVIASSLGDKLHDGHETEGPCAGCHSDARSIVDAALADYLTEEET